MKFFKPTWISHNGLPICSIDVHPDGSRVATGGLGEEGSGKIIIWNMEPVISEEKEQNKNVPRVLCQLDNHLACVNCVRWNISGKLLASGGDDKLVMLWSLSKMGGSNLGMGESWRCTSILRGHDGDVLDVSWSPSAAWLATCSVDNTVIIWQTTTTPPCILTTLRGHEGLVKGVAWDPVGSYLATQADDRSVRIWRTADWRMEASVTTPFTKCSGTTLVLRLSWSPDGLYLVTAHAMNGRVPTAQIIDRESWQHDNDFVGHHMAVTCVRFSRDIMEVDSKDSKGGRPSRSCCVILGSRDRGLSVWMTRLKRPVVVVENVFVCPVNDISWGPGGLSAMACSTDGTVAYMEFSRAELGRPISQTDKDQVLQKLYGRSSCEPDGGYALLETYDILDFDIGNDHSPVRPASPHASHNSIGSSCGGSKQSTPPMLKQIETRRADGKRRITPVFIPPSSSDMGDEVGPFSSDTNTTPFPLVPQRNKIDRQDDAQNSTLPAVMSVAAPGATPMISANESGFTTLSSVSKRINSRKLSEVQQAPTQIVPNSAGSGKIVGPKANFHVFPPSKAYFTNLNKLPNCKDWLSIEKVASGERGKFITLIRRYPGPMTPQPGQSPMWTYALGLPVDSFVADRKIVVIATGPCVHLLDAVRGNPLQPPLALSSGISYLSLLPKPPEKTNKLLVCITVDGKLSSWKVEGNKLCSRVHYLSMEPVLPYSSDGTCSEVDVKECFLSEDQDLLVAFSNGKAYMYSDSFGSWMLLGDDMDVVNRVGGPRWPASSTSVHPDQLPLKRVRAAATAPPSTLQRIGGLGVEVARACQDSRMKGSLAAALAVGSAVEYEMALITYVNYLIDLGDEKQLKDIMNDLLGPCHSTPGPTPDWEPRILGLDKRKLLQVVMNSVVKNIQMQRLYTEFKNLLDFEKLSLFNSKFNSTN